MTWRRRGEEGGRFGAGPECLTAGMRVGWLRMGTSLREALDGGVMRFFQILSTGGISEL